MNDINEVTIGKLTGWQHGKAFLINMPSSNPSNEPYAVYVINVAEGPLTTCSCLGYRYRWACRHSKEVVEQFINSEYFGAGLRPSSEVGTQKETTEP